MRLDSTEKWIKTNLDNWKRHFDFCHNKMLPQEHFQPNSVKCIFPWVSAFIDVHGNVKPCPVFVWEKGSYSWVIVLKIRLNLYGTDRNTEYSGNHLNAEIESSRSANDVFHPAYWI